MTDNHGAPESAAESILAPARNETVLFQPLPLENIGFVELLEDTLHYTQFHKLWTLESPFQNLASSQECLPAAASPVFLFQLSGQLCAILDEGGKYIWQKLDTSWFRLGAWPGAKPVYYADSGLDFTIILSVTPQGKGAGLTLISMDGKIRSIPPEGLGGDPRSLNIIGDAVYISSVNPAAIFTCSTIALLEWLNSDSSASPFSLALDSLPCAVHNMLDAGDAPVFARGGRTELFNAQGEQLFLDEAKANCGFQINAAFTPSLSGKWHIIGTVQRDEVHPRACLYLLDSHFQPRMKKTGDNGLFSAYAGYIMRNRRSGGQQTVFANSAGWPLLVRTYETVGDFQNSGLAENLKLEYAAENAFFYSRAPIAHSDNIQSAGSGGSASLSPASFRWGPNWPFANTRSADTGRTACKLPYPRIEISHEELKNIAHFPAGPVWYRINWDGVDFDFLVVSKKPSRKLVILGTGDFDKSRNPMPIFSRHSWWEDINANCIWYFDPSALQGEASLCWGYGTNDRWLLKDIASLLEIMASALDAPEMLFFGSSGAGYTSLALATLLRKKALAINPQLDCLAFYPSIVEKFLRSCVAGGGGNYSQAEYPGADKNGKILSRYDNRTECRRQP